MASPPKGYVLNRYPNRLTAKAARWMTIEAKEDRVTHVLTLVETQAHLGYNKLQYREALTDKDRQALVILGYKVKAGTDSYQGKTIDSWWEIEW